MLADGCLSRRRGWGKVMRTHCARTGAVVHGGTTGPDRRWRRPCRYAAKGGACERRLLCKTSSMRLGMSGGGLMAGAEHCSARNMMTGTRCPAAGVAPTSSTAMTGSFTPSTTSTVSDLQHPCCMGWCDFPPLAGAGWCLHQLCSPAETGAVFAVSISASAQWFESTSHAIAATATEAARNAKLVRRAFNGRKSARGFSKCNVTYYTARRKIPRIIFAGFNSASARVSPGESAVRGRAGFRPPWPCSREQRRRRRGGDPRIRS